ncbi:hypothetical protein CRE_07000 [Caenorhabditis remanei]|uniref:Uncharacterized protein n=1 Tax=Caenorhabditis remanei TaxID=31234 RepID=E3NB12_CAERE|nr:hypothetical protein CRE_07000 [Caenorhabditis remanei]
MSDTSKPPSFRVSTTVVEFPFNTPYTHTILVTSLEEQEVNVDMFYSLQPCFKLDPSRNYYVTPIEINVSYTPDPPTPYVLPTKPLRIVFEKAPLDKIKVYEEYTVDIRIVDSIQEAEEEDNGPNITTQLACKICCLFFSKENQDQMPKKLKACGHIICQKCYEDIQNEKPFVNRIVCPFDGKETRENTNGGHRNLSLADVLRPSPPVDVNAYPAPRKTQIDFQNYVQNLKDVEEAVVLPELEKAKIQRRTYYSEKHSNNIEEIEKHFEKLKKAAVSKYIAFRDSKKGEIESEINHIKSLRTSMNGIRETLEAHLQKGTVPESIYNLRQEVETALNSGVRVQANFPILTDFDIPLDMARSPELKRRRIEE